MTTPLDLLAAGRQLDFRGLPSITLHHDDLAFEVGTQGIVADREQFSAVRRPKLQGPAAQGYRLAPVNPHGHYFRYAPLSLGGESEPLSIRTPLGGRSPTPGTAGRLKFVNKGVAFGG